jgi:hypothetical protein
VSNLRELCFIAATVFASASCDFKPNDYPSTARLHDASEEPTTIDGGAGDSYDGAGDSKSDPSEDEELERGPDAGESEGADVSEESDSPQLIEACSSDCSEGGVTRCEGKSRVQMCATLGGECAQWVDIGACAELDLCCGGVCVSTDQANCFECGVRCSGQTPICSDTLKRCVCTEESCASRRQSCDVETGVCVPSPLPPMADYYVDAFADEGGDGSSAKPFKTISAAVTDAGLHFPAAAKSIYVAPGTYDAALGEHFPIALRGLSVQGAGINKTIVVGSGEFDHSASGGSYNAQYRSTFLVGDATLATRISKMSIRPVSTGPAYNYFGILCDRGGGSSGDIAPPGQSAIDQVTMGPGYHIAIVATTSTVPAVSGCNLRMTASTLTGGWIGIHAIGCGAGVGKGPVLLDVGDDDPSKGNSIAWMQLPSAGWGVLAQSCVTSGTFRNNSFSDSGSGINVDQRGEAGVSVHPFVFKRNVFQRLSINGLTVLGDSSVIPELSGNVFVDISSSQAATADYPDAIGLIVDIGALRKARDNQFIGNDIGAYLGVSNLTGPKADFGTIGDPGKNLFRCSSSPSAMGGADVLIAGTGSGTISFVGNYWDHNPPTIQASTGYANGSDVALTGDPHPSLEVGGSMVGAVPCPVGRAPGP